MSREVEAGLRGEILKLYEEIDRLLMEKGETEESLRLTRGIYSASQKKSAREKHEVEGELRALRQQISETQSSARERVSNLQWLLDISDRRVEQLQTKEKADAQVVAALENEISSLKEQRVAYVSQLNAIQKNIYEMTKPIGGDGKTHDEISRLFANLFRDVNRWVNDYCKNHSLSPEAQIALEGAIGYHWGNVVYDGFNCTRKRSLALVTEAAISDYLAREILLNPFALLPLAVAASMGAIFNGLVKGKAALSSQSLWMHLC